MAISILGTPAYLDKASFTSSTTTLSVTVPSGTKLLLIGATINDFDWNKLTSITVNGSSSGVVQAATTPNAQANRSIRFWYVINPTVGTYNIVLTFTTSSNNGGGVLGLCLDGVDTTTPIHATGITSAGTPTSPLSTAITTPAGSWAIGAFHADVGTPTRDPSQTVLGTDQNGHSFSYKQDATAFSMTFTGSPQIAQVVLSLKLAAPSGTTIDCTPGNAVANGVNASIQQASSTTINCSVGNTAAAGVNATVATYIVSDVMHNNNGTVHANQAVVYNWVPGGRVGSSLAAAVQGTGTTNSSGRLVSNIVRTAGMLIVAKQNTGAADDHVYYEGFAS